METLLLLVNPERNPNEIGEILRSEFFTDAEKDGFGCYENFNLQPLVKELPDEIMDEDKWTCATHLNIKMMYHWDGDGTLIFVFADGSCLVNTDCKKDYNWEYFNKIEELWDQ